MPSPAEITAPFIEDEDLSAYINEYAYDDEGNPISSSTCGWKMTARGAKAREQAYLEILRESPPMEQLPAEYDAELRPDTDAVLAFGLGISFDQLLRYVHKRNIRTPWKPYRRITQPLVAFNEISKRLKKAIPGLQLFYRRPASVEYDRVLALYSNHSMGRLQYEEEDEQRVIEYIKKELEIDSPPLWFWDMDEEDTF
ncbi:hypothetical protein HETIRDRAFT_118857 [Heterobasidion irregulare TC 32-1]|uniref:Uncharacterized protein n=1 Tax=Heterobasidion irregulare (strain TC 32-1) TaxID=747525 RepID=W4JSS5_HETIT|nr:uncharacterized protein HETIRDRAFT_118857 [Heterobasidion irregulare TC 32-1]ETW76617.1 hypothetical protein HETIRDRAFT_118857 [Heterobasidion irregulare TC 32-1]